MVAGTCVLKFYGKIQCLFEPLRGFKHGKGILASVVIGSSGEEGCLSDPTGHFSNVCYGAMLCGRKRELGLQKNVV